MRDVALNLVDSTAEANRFLAWLDQPRPWLGVDTETSGLNWWQERLRTVQFGDAQSGWCLPVEGASGWGGLAEQALRQYDHRLAFQNFKFDAHFLEKAGFTVKRWNAHDVRIMAHLHDNESATGLKPLAVRYLDASADRAGQGLDDAMKKNRWTFGTVPVAFDLYWQYAALDTVLTARLADRLYPEVEERWSRAYDTEIGAQLALLDMETRGIRIDREYCVDRIARMRHDQAELAGRIQAEYGVDNPNGSKQVITALQKAGVTLSKRTEKGALSLDEDALSQVDHPLGKMVLKWRHLDKIASTYLENFLTLADKDDVLHPSMNLLGAKTGRMSVSKPSLQNLERSPDVRDAFVPRPGNVLLLVDYDQIELRLLAHYAQEQSMMKAINEGHDLHTEMCRAIFHIPDDEEVPREKRMLTKNGTFAKLYGAGIKKFAMTVGVSYAEGEAFLKAYDERFPTVRAFQSAVHDLASMRKNSEEGFPFVNTWLGRRLRAQEDKVYKMVNYLIQGTAAEVLKYKLVALDLAGLTDYLVLPVHDEFVFDVPKAEVEDFTHAVKETIECRTEFSVPLTVSAEVVSRWGDKYRKEEA